MPQNEELRFDGEVVIVTGAGRGLGRQYALLFAERGASVVVNDAGFTPDGGPGDDDVAGAVVAEIRERGGRALADTTDVSIDGGAESIVQAAMDAFGTVSAVVNNAGVITYASFDELTLAQWQRMDEVTMGGAFRMSKAVWPVFKRNACGRIVNTTSAAGFAGSDFLAHYGAAKLGVAGLTKCLAIEGANSGIKVNAIAPMAVTRMNSEQFFGGAQTPAMTGKTTFERVLFPSGRHPSWPQPLSGWHTGVPKSPVMSSALPPAESRGSDS